MTKDAFYDNICCELEQLAKTQQMCEEKLKDAIEGHIYIRENKTSTTYYQVIQNNNHRKRINISNQPEIIEKLLTKSYNQQLLRICRNNIKNLKQTLKTYQPLLPLEALKENEKSLLLNHYRNMPAADYYKAPYDPNRHIHETVCGELVSSKGEVIIVNALWHFDIPFNYEELFPYTDDDGNWFYPDFTIHCPDGTVIIWEHLGLLSRMDYCVHNAGKLHTYHENGYVIGKNLILTQDDNKGNCTTVLVYHIIEHYILPHFK